MKQTGLAGVTWAEEEEVKVAVWPVIICLTSPVDPGLGAHHLGAFRDTQNQGALQSNSELKIKETGGWGVL